jgi:hypothetical protein
VHDREMDPFYERAKRHAQVEEWVWRVGALLAIVLAAVFLGGCAAVTPTTSLAAGHAGGASSSAVPGSEPTPLPSAFGRCWNEPYNSVSVWTTWQGADYVPCAEAHTTYTYAVENLPAREAAAFTMALSESQSAQSESAARSAIAEAAAETCEVEFEYLVPTRRDEYSLVSSFAFVPSDTEWEAGARWVRCDIGLLIYSTPQSVPRFATLPTDITDLALSVQRYPHQYEVCLIPPSSSESNVPHADGAVAVRCDEGEAWHFFASVPVGYAPESGYPGVENLSAASASACRTAADELDEPDAYVWWFYPSENGWADGSRVASCWSYLP